MTDEKTKKERLIEELRRNGLNNSEFGLAIGKTKQYVSSMRSYMSPLTCLTAKERYPQLDWQYVETGVRSDQADETDFGDVLEATRDYNKLLDEYKNLFNQYTALKQENEKLNEELTRKNNIIDKLLPSVRL